MVQSEVTDFGYMHAGERNSVVASSLLQACNVENWERGPEDEDIKLCPHLARGVHICKNRSALARVQCSGADVNIII